MLQEVHRLDKELKETEKNVLDDDQLLTHAANKFVSDAKAFLPQLGQFRGQMRYNLALQEIRILIKNTENRMESREKRPGQKLHGGRIGPEKDQEDNHKVANTDIILFMCP